MKTKLVQRGFCVVMIVAATIGCGPTVRKTPALEGTKLQTLAVLPTKFESDIRRERAEYIRRALIRDMQTSGYVMLDEKIVDKVCPDAACPNRAQLHEKYNVDALVELTLKSEARVNFFAGYYNTVHGEVRFLTPDSKELISVDHQESERGGVLFSSGQVIQGIIESYQNGGDDSFNKLAERFSKAVVLKLPRASGGAAFAKVSDVNITSSHVTPLGDARFQICVEGNPGASAELVVDRVRTPLREGRPGVYCNALQLGGLVQPTSRVTAQLKSSFGVPAEQAIDPAPFLSCAPKNLVSRSEAGANPRLMFGCNDSLPSDEKARCESQLASCTGSQFYIYRAQGPLGPFQKVGQSVDSNWIDKQAKAADKPYYAVVAVSKNSGASVPVQLNEQK